MPKFFNAFSSREVLCTSWRGNVVFTFTAFSLYLQRWIPVVWTHHHYWFSFNRSSAWKSCFPQLCGHFAILLQFLRTNVNRQQASTVSNTLSMIEGFHCSSKQLSRIERFQSDVETSPPQLELLFFALTACQAVGSRGALFHHLRKQQHSNAFLILAY